MPLIRLEVRQGRSATQKQALLDAAHAAWWRLWGIPDHDRMQRIVEHARDDFELPPGCSDDFVLVEVTMFAGRSRQAKRRLYQALVRNFGELGVAPADVFVVLQEPPTDNWGIRGGQMASEVDLGFEVQAEQLTTPQASAPDRHSHTAVILSQVNPEGGRTQRLQHQPNSSTRPMRVPARNRLPQAAQRPV